MLTENHLKNHVLAPISELYSTDNLQLEQETKVFGQLKENSALISFWKPKIQLRLDIYKAKTNKTKDGDIELSFDLIDIKLTKKCIKIQDKPCFGIIKNSKKYLVSLENIHQCAKFHGNILLAKQLIKEMSLQHLNTPINNVQQKGLQKRTVQQDKNVIQEQEINYEEQNVIIQKRYTHSAQSYSELSVESQNNKEIAKTLCEPSTSQMDMSNLESQSHLKCHLSQEEAGLLDKDTGFQLHSKTQNDIVMMRNEHKMKAKLLLNTRLNLNNCIEMLFKMQKWNSAIKEFKIIKKSQEGLYIAYIQFTNEHHLEFVKYTYVVVTLWEQKNQKLIIMRSLKKDRSQHQSIFRSILKTRINIKMLIKINQDSFKPDNKLVTLCLLSDSASNHLCTHFMSQIHNFHKYIQENSKDSQQSLFFKKGKCCQTYCPSEQSQITQHK